MRAEVDRLALLAWFGAQAGTPSDRLFERDGDRHVVRMVASFLFKQNNDRV